MEKITGWVCQLCGVHNPNPENIVCWLCHDDPERAERLEDENLKALLTAVVEGLTDSMLKRSQVAESSAPYHEREREQRDDYPCSRQH